MNDEQWKAYKQRWIDYANKNDKLIKQVLKDAKQCIFPQHILEMKSGTIDALKDTNDESTFTRADGRFYVSESLVNRLMLFSYEKGKRYHDNASYERGWEDCKEEICKHLDIPVCTGCNDEYN